MLAGGEIKLQLSRPGCLELQNRSCIRGEEGFQRCCFHASKRSLEMTATTWCHLVTGQGLKLRKKKGFREENRAEESPTPPKLFEEWM